MHPIAIIGGGPAGLMAAEVVATAGLPVTVYDHMPSVGRKFLMAGRGGLNLTHSEPLDQLIARYGAATWLEPVIRGFPPTALVEWCHGLGQETFVGSSGRIFPVGLKASPLLRAWLRRLDGLGVRFALRHKWLGWQGEDLLFEEQEPVKAGAVLLALGGASWPRLGSDGKWADILAREGVGITPLAPANCGFVVPWSKVFRARFEGQPLKSVLFSFQGRSVQGDAIVTGQGLEGGPVYALSARLREAIAAEGFAMLTLDLRAGLPQAALAERLRTPRGSQSFSNHLRKHGGLSPLAIGLIYEAQGQKAQAMRPEALAGLIKACPVRLTAPVPIERAISTAGGIKSEALDGRFMSRGKPGVFACGEMLDWDAPTGGYLLQASFSTAVAAAKGLVDWVQTRDVNP